MINMVKVLLILSLTSHALAQYVWSGFSASGGSPSYQCIRPNSNGANPLLDVTSVDIRCGAAQQPSAATCTVPAGGPAAFHLTAPISYPGVVNIYMAKAPTGTTAATWSGAGTAWFKVKQVSVVISSSGVPSWPVLGQQVFSFTIPAALSAGQYLARAEFINLVNASVLNGARFHVGCVQLNVVGGAGKVPGPLVPIQGVYTPTHTGILVSIAPPMAPYNHPGPPVWP